MWGRTVRFGAPSSGSSAGSGSGVVTSSPAPAISPSSSASRSALLVDEVAARRVDQKRRRLHRRELGRADQAAGLPRSAARAGRRSRPRRAAVRARRPRPALRTPHAEALGPPGDRRADRAVRRRSGSSRRRRRRRASPRAPRSATRRPGPLPPPRRSAARRRAAAQRSRSAVASVSTPGVLPTGMPRRAHSSRSMLSVPTAMFEIARIDGQASSSSASTRSVSRQSSPSASAAERPQLLGESAAAPPRGRRTSWPALAQQLLRLSGQWAGDRNERHGRIMPGRREARQPRAASFYPRRAWRAQQQTPAADAAISVVMVTYDSADAVGRSLPAIVAELRAGDELIVCDNGSADGTVERVRELAPDATRDRDPRQPGLRRRLQRRRGRRGQPAAAPPQPRCRRPAPGFRDAIVLPLAEGRGWDAWQGLLTSAGGDRGQHLGRCRPLHRHRLGRRRRPADRRGTGGAGRDPLRERRLPADPRASSGSGSVASARRTSSTTRTPTSACACGLAAVASASSRAPASSTSTSSTRGSAKWRYLETNRWATILRTYPRPPARRARLPPCSPPSSPCT